MGSDENTVGRFCEFIVLKTPWNYTCILCATNGLHMA